MTPDEIENTFDRVWQYFRKQHGKIMELEVELAFLKEEVNKLKREPSERHSYKEI